MPDPASRGLPRAPVALAREQPMSRFTAPVGFTLVAIWIAVVFVLVSGPH